MEDNHADVFDPREDNLYVDDPSPITQISLFVPFPPEFYFDTTVDSSTTPSVSYDSLLDSSLDSSAFLTDIQSTVRNNALQYSFDTSLPYGGSQYPPWDFFEMDEMIPVSHESIKEINPTSTDGNNPPNGITHNSPRPKPAQHNHPYVCTQKSCARKPFSNKSGLERHKREVHSPQQFKCPFPSCSRSKAGFHRRYNLDMHQRRVHGSQSSSNSPPGLYNNSEDSEEGDETTLRSPHDRHGSTDAMLQDDAALKTKGGVDRKLQRLRLMRDELDEDIKLMERASRIMREEY
ncbi:hypothetical protein V490_00902 [Pseudogymnoascus sp. VKM F-3557]|nr:hypothetical protein V490_00902 [Pseudogymnoascus sp. VKM F-3557]